MFLDVPGLGKWDLLEGILGNINKTSAFRLYAELMTRYRGSVARWGSLSPRMIVPVKGGRTLSVAFSHLSLFFRVSVSRRSRYTFVPLPAVFIILPISILAAHLEAG